MGAQGSKPDHEQSASGDDHTFFASRQQPFSETLINQLSSGSTSGESSSAVPASRQQALDVHIQQRIAAELAQLRQQEQQVREEIERALERENLDRERNANAAAPQDGAEADGANKGLSHSASLFKDLERLEKRALGLKRERAETDEWKSVDTGKEALARCFREHRQNPLDCRAEAEKFKAAVAGVEKAFFSTLD
ncbi:hypothetical protein JCM8202v2_001772 [Rhodotorula sphaerocarpa]